MPGSDPGRSDLFSIRAGGWFPGWFPPLVGGFHAAGSRTGSGWFCEGVVPGSGRCLFRHIWAFFSGPSRAAFPASRNMRAASFADTSTGMPARSSWAAICSVPTGHTSSPSRTLGLDRLALPIMPTSPCRALDGSPTAHQRPYPPKLSRVRSGRARPPTAEQDGSHRVEHRRPGRELIRPNRFSIGSTRPGFERLQPANGRAPRRAQDRKRRTPRAARPRLASSKDRRPPCPALRPPGGETQRGAGG